MDQNLWTGLITALCCLAFPVPYSYWYLFQGDGCLEHEPLDIKQMTASLVGTEFGLQHVRGGRKEENGSKKFARGDKGISTK